MFDWIWSTISYAIATIFWLIPAILLAAMVAIGYRTTTRAILRVLRRRISPSLPRHSSLTQAQQERIKQQLSH